jgi:multidrug resistance efflux pump
MKPTPNEIRLERANRRIQRRDRKIAGLQREIKRLENALAWRSMDLESLSRNVRREVQDALCNVRMIPINQTRTIPTNTNQ